MKLNASIFLFLIGFALCTHAQESDMASSKETTIVVLQSSTSSKELKQQEKEAVKANKALKKQHQLEQSILDVEERITKGQKASKKLQDKHLSSASKLNEVKREKIELKIAKLEMQMAKDRQKLKKYRKKLR